MKEDSQNQREAEGARSVPPLLTNHQTLVDQLFAESGGSCWGLTRELFEVALERSVSKHVGSATITPEKLEEFLGALHLSDLALATACDSGQPEAWNHFVVAYRGYLRSAAGAILRRSAGSPEACDLADSLFAELYGLGDAKPGGRSLLRYFHGRSSLKTWLRAVLAQRQVDAIRAHRRFTDLDARDRDDPSLRGESQVPRIQSPADPHRERYLALFQRTLKVALGLLDPRDHQRLRWYYAEERTLAAIGRALGEHESSVSRNLERIRRQLRRDVEAALRKGRIAANGSSPEPGLSNEEIALCFEYASEDAPIDLDKLFPRSAQPPRKPGSQEP